MSKDRHCIDPLTDINNKIYAYNIIFQRKPNAIIIPSKIYKEIKFDLLNFKENIIVCDDFKEIRCINILEG